MRKTGIIFRMENAEGGATAVDQDEVLADAVESTEGAAEVESASGDVTEVETGIENAVEAQSELASIEGSLEEAAEEDGVTPREAEHIQARLERVASLLGTTTADMGLTMRRESFGGSSSRVAATRMRLESVREWGRKIWDALKKAWNWFKDAVTNLFHSITKNAEGVEKRLKGQLTRVKELGGAVKTKKSELSAGARVFSIDGKVDFEGMLSQAQQYAKVMEDAAAASVPGSATAIKEAGDVAAFAKKIEDALTVGGKFKGAVPEKVAKNATHGIRLPGGKAIILADDEAQAGEEKVKVLAVRVEQIDEKLAENYGALPADKLKLYIETALVIAENLKKFQKVEGEYNRTIEANVKYCEEQAKITDMLSNKKEAADIAAAKKQAGYGRAAMTMALGASKVAVNKMPSSAFEVIKAVADVVDANLSNVEADKK